MNDRSPANAPTVKCLSIPYRVLFVFLLAIGLCLRLWGIHWGLPLADRFTPLYIDEYTVFHVLSVMDPSHHQFDPHHFIDPPFFIYQVGVALKLLAIFHWLTLSSGQAFYLAHPEAYDRLYLAGRYLVTLYGMMGIGLLFFLGRRVTRSNEGGLLTALFYAVIPLAVLSSKIVEIGIPVSVWLGLTFLLLLRAVDESRRALFFASCLTAGLSFSIKYTAAPMALPILYVLWRLKLGSSGVAMAVVLGLCGFLIGNPYAVLDYSTFIRDFLNAFGQAGDPGAPASAYQFLQPILQYRYAIGTPLALFSLWGLMVGLRRGQTAAWIAALYLVPYFLILGKSGMLITRYLNETLPFLLPFAAVPILQVTTLKKGRWLAGGFLLLILSILPYSLAIDRSLARDIDPRDQASQWIVSHLPSQTLIGLEYEANFMTPGHLYMDYWKGRRYPLDSVQSPAYRYTVWNPSPKEWGSGRPEYWIENNLFYSPYGKKEPRVAAALASRRALRAGSHPLVTFSRHVDFGPFHYPLPRESGWEWIIFFPEITVYAEDAKA